MKSSRFLLVACAALPLLCFSLTSASSLAFGQIAPDNSGQNKRQTSTADNQPNAKGDRLTTARVRKAIMKDKDLSTYGHNVKIITMNGTVTLKGPVKSEEEKQKVVSDVAGVVSPDKITDALTIRD